MTSKEFAALLICSTIVAIVLICCIANAVVEHARAKYGVGLLENYAKKSQGERQLWNSKVREVPLKYGSTDDSKDTEPGAR